MTGFRFIHAADLHLGSPLSGLALKDPQIAERFAAAGRAAFSALIERALDEAVDFMIIAGDVYDGPWRDNHVGLFFNREVARLTRAGIPVYLLRGNHDAESIVARTIAMPEGVHEFSTKRPQTFQIEKLKVALHGQGFAERSVSENLALSYPAAEAGWFNIGVLHTSLSGRPPHAPYAPCTPDDLRSRGYDYWALGHVHAFEEVLREPLTLYPGNLQGRNIRETGEKGAVLVTVDEGRISYERLIVDCARFEAVNVVIEPTMHDSNILQSIEEAAGRLGEAASQRVTALRVQLSGNHPAARRIRASRSQWHDDVQAALQRVHADIWLEKLVLDLHEPIEEETPEADGAMMDITRLIDEIAKTPEAHEDAEALIADIARRLPGSLAAAEAPLDATAKEVLEEAQAIIRTRLGLNGAA